MITVRKSFIIITALLFTPLIGLGQLSKPLQEMEQQADSLYDAFREQQALEAYKKILEENPNHYTALWRTSFLYSRLGNRFKEKDDQKEYFNKAISFAERALQVKSTGAQANFVMAVAKGRKALISGARDRVAASRDIKKYADRAIKYDSTHAGAWHVLGRWNFKVANLSWIERAAANTLFGGIPGDASNRKAVKYINKAIDLNDQYVLYFHDLATVYEDLGQDKKAISACRKGLDTPNLTPDDKDLKNECRDLIEDLR
jgi:tetratricopeptide (TPR) repeat protein